VVDIIELRLKLTKLSKDSQTALKHHAPGIGEK
jgi:hypothetical protein